MRLGLTSILALHWAIVFALLAYGSITNAGVIGDLPASLGIEPIDASASGPLVLFAVILAGNFVFAAMLFGWLMLTSLLSRPGAQADNNDLSRIAYGAAVSSLTILLIVCLARGGPVPYVALATQIAALGVSYLAGFAERLDTVLNTTPEADDVKAAARLMALGAAHGAMLPRIAGRDFAAPDGAR